MYLAIRLFDINNELKVKAIYMTNCYDKYITDEGRIAPPTPYRPRRGSNNNLLKKNPEKNAKDTLHL
jgi:hypothetical protein